MTRVRCPTLGSGARTLDSSALLPSHFCTPLKESGRPDKDEAVNEVGRDVGKVEAELREG